MNEILAAVAEFFLLGADGGNFHFCDRTAANYSSIGKGGILNFVLALSAFLFGSVCLICTKFSVVWTCIFWLYL